MSISYRGGVGRRWPPSSKKKKKSPDKNDDTPPDEEMARCVSLRHKTEAAKVINKRHGKKVVVTDALKCMVTKEVELTVL